MNERLNRFLDAILASRKVWLLEAKPGFFAMLEDNDGNSYVPLWENETLATQAAQGDWEQYTVADMGFSELERWLKELANDEIDIAISPVEEGEITALASANFRKWVTQYSDHSYKEPKDDDQDDDQDDDDFDYGDGWAQPWQ